MKFSLAYKQVPGIRGELQGGVWEVFNLLFEEFSLNFPVKFSIEIREQSPYLALYSL